MIDITRETELPGTPEQVAEFIADLPRWPQWFALHKGWIGEPPSKAEPGVRFKQRVRVLGIPGEIGWEVTVVEVPAQTMKPGDSARIVLKGKGTSRTRIEVDFRIARAGGGSQIAFTAKLGGLALRPVGSQLRPWVETQADRTLAAMASMIAIEAAREP